LLRARFNLLERTSERKLRPRTDMDFVSSSNEKTCLDEKNTCAVDRDRDAVFLQEK